MRFGLRTRVALAFGVLAFIVASLVAGATYGFARWYLIDQREDAALTRAVLDARAVNASLNSGVEPPQALEQVPSVGTSQSLVRIEGTWYSAGATIPAEDIPLSLLNTAAIDGAAQQRAEVGEDAYYLVAISLPEGVYVEVFSLRDLDLTFTIGGWLLGAQTVVAGLLGFLIGRYTVGQILRPLNRLGAGARRIASGELSTRIALTGDPDLDPIAGSFNGMAEAVQSRITRERRFSGNVSHELRSPLTAVLGTTELLERRKDELPEREAGLISVLADQVRRMSQMLLDLLEISRIGADDPLQLESVDLFLLCLDAVQMRGLSDSLVAGDSIVVRTDARRFERIVGNLIDNANRHGQGVVGVTVSHDQDFARVTVEDRGPGVDPAQLDKLFEPFTRGNDAHHMEGAGLGLAIAREQAGLLGAKLSLRPAQPQGAAFTVEIPIGANDA